MQLWKHLQKHPQAHAIVGLIVLTLYPGITNADYIRFATTARDPGVGRVISYEILGPTNHPLPILYVSIKRFPTWNDEFLIVLPTQGYSAISEYTKGRIARSECPGTGLMGVGYAVRITKRDNPLVHSCILQKAMACEYFSGVLQIPGISWKPTERKLIADFMAELPCDARAL